MVNSTGGSQEIFIGDGTKLLPVYFHSDKVRVYDTAFRDYLVDLSSSYHVIRIIKYGQAKWELYVDGSLALSGNVFFDQASNFIRFGQINTPTNVTEAYWDYVYYSKNTTVIPDAPTGLTATSNGNQVTLNWNSVPYCTGYTVKRAIYSGGPYTIIQSNHPSTSFIDTPPTNGTYYYVVSAVNYGGESTNSNEVSVTIQNNRAILLVTLTNGLQKEYDLTMAEINTFIAWYDNRANSVGPARYIVNKSYNKGPFVSRKDYLIFDKIQNFEVMEYVSN